MDHLVDIFDVLPYDLVLPGTLAEQIREEIKHSSSELLDHEGVAGGMAETNIIFDEVSDIEVDKYEYFEKEALFLVRLTASASGSHRNEPDIGGQGIDIGITATCRATIGKYGLMEHEIEDGAPPKDYR